MLPILMGTFVLLVKKKKSFEVVCWVYILIVPILEYTNNLNLVLLAEQSTVKSSRAEEQSRRAERQGAGQGRAGQTYSTSRLRNPFILPIN